MFGNLNRVQPCVERCSTHSGSQIEYVSVGRLDDEGYTGSIRNGVMKFCKGSLIVARARKTNTLYLMHARLCRNEVNVAVREDLAVDYKTLADHHSEEVVQLLEEYGTAEVEIVRHLHQYEADRKGTGLQPIEKVELQNSPTENPRRHRSHKGSHQQPLRHPTRSQPRGSHWRLHPD